MSSSDSDSDFVFNSHTSSSRNDSFSITKRLLAEPIYKEDPFESSSNLTHNLIHTTLSLVPLVVLPTLSKKRRYSGSTHDRKKRNKQNSNDYFMGEGSKFFPEVFRRHFRMDKDLFDRILVAIKVYDDYFTQRAMITSLKMLAHGVIGNDEYTQIGQNVALENLFRFCDAVIGVYEGRYMRKPNGDDIKKLLEQNEARRFPGMIGSIDCIHWRQINGFEKVPNLVFEIVASEDLWIWHAFLRVVGTYNNITVFDRSPFFDDTVNGVAPPCNFEVQGHQYNTGYYLSDGIYPKHAALIQTISEPSNPGQRYFCKLHESVRKDVERAFRVLLKRWRIIKDPLNMWNANCGKIVKTCIILHNMIIESERRQGFDPEKWEPLDNEDVQSVELEHDNDFLVDIMIDRFKQVREKGVQNDLKIDLMKNMWKLHGNDPI